MKTEDREETPWLKNYSGISAEIESSFLLSCNSNSEKILSVL